MIQYCLYHIHRAIPLATQFMLFYFIFCHFRAVLAAYGGSQTQGQIGAVAPGLRHNSWQCRILNLLSKARDQTHVLMDTSQVRYWENGNSRPQFILKHFLYPPFPTKKLSFYLFLIFFYILIIFFNSFIELEFTHYTIRSFFFFFFWLCLQHVEVPGPGIEPVPVQWQYQILNCEVSRELQGILL